MEHRIGGLEKEDGTGDISYDPENHEHMTRLRAERVARVAVPDVEVDDPDGDASLLVLGWGSSYGAIQGAARRLRREQGVKVATAHIRHLNPLPGNLEEVLRSYERVLVPETNMGQLVKLLRAEYLLDLESYSKVDGMPILTADVMAETLRRSVLYAMERKRAQLAHALVHAASHAHPSRSGRVGRAGVPPVVCVPGVGAADLREAAGGAEVVRKRDGDAKTSGRVSDVEGGALVGSLATDADGFVEILDVDPRRIRRNAALEELSDQRPQGSDPA